ncbi:MAG: hypothetical protein RLZZ09_1082 [Pseudomonadota bacterium]
MEDHDINMSMIERTLEQLGCEYRKASDGSQALEVLKTHSTEVDVVLMDIQMPVIDGLTATRAIREELHMRTLPVIALTAGVLPEEKQQALEAGVNDFLPKPMDMDLMASMIRSYCPASA